MTSTSDILKQMKDNDIKFVDLRFTDPRGKLQHLTMDAGLVDEDMFAEALCLTALRLPAGRQSMNQTCC